MEKTITYDARNPGPGWGQAQKCGRFKPVNGITTLPFLLAIDREQTQIVNYVPHWS